MSAFWNSVQVPVGAVRGGLRFGEVSTHTSRTMMLSELRELLATVPSAARREEYAAAIIEDNVLGKQTASTRRITNQRLSELYVLDPTVPLFRVLRRLWELDEAGRPLLALLCALGRDPLLRASAPAVLELAPGAELTRSTLGLRLREVVGGRLNDSVLDKVARNVASSWTQSGHLSGRVRKIRRQMAPGPGPAAFAAWLGSLCGYAGRQLLTTPWAKVFDCSPAGLFEQLTRAGQMRLLRARNGGGVMEIDTTGLDAAVAGGA